MIKLVLFDLDNTLYPTYRQVRKCRENAVRAMIKRGLKGSEKEISGELETIIRELGSNSQRHFDELVKRIAGDYDLSIISAGITAYNITKQKLMKPYKDVRKTLRKLIKKGYEIGVLTNGEPKKQWDKINRLGLYRYFGKNVWVCRGEKVPLIREILKTYGLNPDEAMLVGDRPDTDILAAKKAGIKSVLLMRGPYAKECDSDYVIKKISSVPGILSKL